RIRPRSLSGERDFERRFFSWLLPLLGHYYALATMHDPVVIVNAGGVPPRRPFLTRFATTTSPALSPQPPPPPPRPGGDPPAQHVGRRGRGLPPAHRLGEAEVGDLEAFARSSYPTSV